MDWDNLEARDYGLLAITLATTVFDVIAVVMVYRLLDTLDPQDGIVRWVVPDGIGIVLSFTGIALVLSCALCSLVLCYLAAKLTDMLRKK
jgi:hypothetical protein